MPHSSPSPPPPPLPDMSPVPRSLGGGNLMVECRYSGDKIHRVLIIRDLRKSFHVFYQIWDTSEWHFSGAAFWRSVETSWTSAGSLADARRVARARLLEFVSPLD